MTFSPSESGECYLRVLLDIRVPRKENGLLYPRFIIDNPALLESELHDLVAAVWGGRNVDYILAGDPVHREIEFDESLDSTHQDAEDSTRDFAYLVRRFGGLISVPPASTLDAEMKKLRAHIDHLRGNMYDYRKDPFSSRHPDNVRNWKRKPTKQCYLETFRSRADEITDFPGFQPTHRRLLLSYFHKGRLARALPVALRNILIDYRENSMSLDGLLLPCGSVRRILLDDARKRYGRKAPRRLNEDCEFYPSYADHRELTREVTRLILWYSVFWRVAGQRKRVVPREDAEIGASSAYPVKASPIFGAKTLDVLRRMLLLQNSVYYLAHIMVARDVYRRNPYPEDIATSSCGTHPSE